ncbi:MAG TPA: hypothetical protein VKM00_05860, partial [Luteimonas sp.]|nr:hypothetical protein [Luteimonas sp.]
MRTLIVAAMTRLDGIMQAPGGPQEDTSGGFAFGGWTWPYADASVEVMGGAFKQWCGLARSIPRDRQDCLHRVWRTQRTSCQTGPCHPAGGARCVDRYAPATLPADPRH